jgi:hypothetical protein
MTDRLIRITTALAVATVAAVAAVISYRHAYELVSTHGEIGLTARLIPFTVDGLILAAGAALGLVDPAQGFLRDQGLMAEVAGADGLGPAGLPGGSGACCHRQHDDRCQAS